jgi:hypothetical protein
MADVINKIKTTLFEDNLNENNHINLSATIDTDTLDQALHELSWRMIFMELSDSHNNPLERLAIEVLHQSANLKK